MHPVISVTVKVADVSAVKTIGVDSSLYESPFDVVQVYVAGPITSVSEIPDSKAR